VPRSTLNLLLTHAGVTSFLAGLIWTIQLVHYPLFAKVSRDVFAVYQQDHSTRITWIVGPAMAVELVCAIWLVAAPPSGVPRWMAWVALGLLGVVHATTTFLSVPAHSTLADGFDQGAFDRLVRTNWLRTVGWSFRAGLALVMLSAFATAHSSRTG
jgi:uncharacterized membrane protein